MPTLDKKSMLTYVSMVRSDEFFSRLFDILWQPDL